jgi:hypothetical protein
MEVLADYVGKGSVPDRRVTRKPVERTSATSNPYGIKAGVARGWLVTRGRMQSEQDPTGYQGKQSEPSQRPAPPLTHCDSLSTTNASVHGSWSPYQGGLPAYAKPSCPLRESMATVKLRVLVPVVLGLTLAACGTSQSVPPTTRNGIGVLTGLAHGCQNPMNANGPSLVRVGLYSGPTLVTLETIRSGTTYRFFLVPGSYRVTVLGNGNSKDIAVVAGRRVTADLSRVCDAGAGLTAAFNTTSVVPTTSTAKPPVGGVTGLAVACVNQFPPNDLPSRVMVLLYSGPILVESSLVRSGARYRFSVAPGAYDVAGWWGRRAVTVRAGLVATANFVNYPCL